MLAIEMVANIAELRSITRLDAIAKIIWMAHGAGALTDDQAQALAEAVHARKKAIRDAETVLVRAPGDVASDAAQSPPERPRERRSSIFPAKRPPKSPDRQRSILRRRRLAASGPLPPPLAANFTTGQLSVLRIIADETESHKGTCTRSLGELAARAGVCVALVRNTLRLAESLFLITTEFRARHGKRHLPSVIRIISKPWNLWLIIGRTVKRHALNAEREPGTLPFPLENAQKRGISAPSGGPRKIGPTGIDLNKSTFFLNEYPQTRIAHQPSSQQKALAPNLSRQSSG